MGSKKKRVVLILWEGPIKGYAVNLLSSQFWRIKHEYQDLEEALQEAYLVFARVRNTYRATVTSQKHFMGLFKSALQNHITNLARKHKHRRSLVYESSLASDEDTAVSVPEVVVTDSQSLSDIVDEAPDDQVRSVLSFFIHTKPEVLRQIGTAWEERGKMKLHGDGFLMEALDVTEGVAERTRDYLRGLKDE